MSYTQKQLAPSVQRQISEALQNDVQIQRELEKIQKAIVYLDSFKALELHPQALEEFNEPDTYLSVLFKKTNYESWPLALKWSVEAAIVLSCFVVLLTLVPWERLLRMSLISRGQDVVIAELPKTHPDAGEGDSPLSADTDKIEVPPDTVATVSAPTTTSTPASPPIVPSAAPVPESAPKAALPPPPEATASKPSTPPPPAPSMARPREGLLYRGVLYVKSLEASEEAIKAAVNIAGGRKAGEVELGWRKTPNSSYFHFALPETNLVDLEDQLKKYGSLKIQKEKHPRLMPLGQIRLIISVEEAQK